MFKVWVIAVLLQAETKFKLRNCRWFWSSEVKCNTNREVLQAAYLTYERPKQTTTQPKLFPAFHLVELTVVKSRGFLGTDLLRLRRGLLDRSTALYFYKGLKTSLHKPRGNLWENLFSKKCAFKNSLQLLEKSFCLKQIQHLKMAFYLAKWPIFKKLRYYSNW